MKFLKLLFILWAIPANAGLPPLPTQSGNSGKYLTTNGYKASWATPSLSAAGYLKADGTVPTTAAIIPTTDNTADQSLGSSTNGFYEIWGHSFNLMDLSSVNQYGWLAASPTNITIHATSASTNIKLDAGALGLIDVNYHLISNVTNPVSSQDAVNLQTISPVTSAISAADINWATLKTKGGLYTKTLSANTTFTFSNLSAGEIINVRITNTASNYTVTFPTIKWSGGTAPTQTIGAKSDVYTFLYDGTDIYGNVVQNF